MELQANPRQHLASLSKKARAKYVREQLEIAARGCETLVRAAKPTTQADADAQAYLLASVFWALVRERGPAAATKACGPAAATKACGPAGALLLANVQAAGLREPDDASRIAAMATVAAWPAKLGAQWTRMWKALGTLGSLPRRRAKAAGRLA
jgi:hypothetical protein